jgi:hypothetical protein
MPPSNFNGILDLANPANPLKDHNIVFVPYCTADIFLGNRTVTYSVPATDSAPERSTQIQHWGSADADSVMNWVYSHFPEPSLVFVTGSSAGAIPSPLYASRVAQHYPNARVVQLGDAAGGYRAKAITDILAGWGATSSVLSDSVFRGVDSATFNLETLYIVGSQATPRVTFTQYNNAGRRDPGGLPGTARRQGAPSGDAVSESRGHTESESAVPFVHEPGRRAHDPASARVLHPHGRQRGVS